MLISQISGGSIDKSKLGNNTKVVVCGEEYVVKGVVEYLEELLDDRVIIKQYKIFIDKLIEYIRVANYLEILNGRGDKSNIGIMSSMNLAIVHLSMDFQRGVNGPVYSGLKEFIKYMYKILINIEHSDNKSIMFDTFWLFLNNGYIPSLVSQEDNLNIIYRKILKKDTSKLSPKDKYILNFIKKTRLTLSCCHDVNNKSIKRGINVRLHEITMKTGPGNEEYLFKKYRMIYVVSTGDSTPTSLKLKHKDYALVKVPRNINNPTIAPLLEKGGNVYKITTAYNGFKFKPLLDNGFKIYAYNVPTSKLTIEYIFDNNIRVYIVSDFSDEWSIVCSKCITLV